MSDFFRPQVLEARRRRLFGEVTIHQPAPLAAFTALAVLTTVAVGTFLATASYARTEGVVGWISPEAGLIQVYAPKAGVAKSVSVKIGDSVPEDGELAVLSTDVTGTGGALSEQERRETLHKIDEVDFQLTQNAEQRLVERKRLVAQADSLKDEITYLRHEQALAERQLALARKQLADISQLTDQGYVSRFSRDQREQAVASQEQALTEVTRLVTAKEAAESDAEAQVKAADVANAVAASQLRSSRAGLAQSMAQIDVEGGVVVRSPVRGRVSAVNVHVGEEPAAATPLFAIAPADTRLSAEVLIPTRSAGFIAPGQTVRLMIDAFPSQRFGPLKGEVASVSHATVSPGQIATPVPLREPCYRVVVHLQDSSIQAYGKAQPLQPGMSLKAYVTTSRRTFLEWMLDPLIAANRRA